MKATLYEEIEPSDKGLIKSRKLSDWQCSQPVENQCEGVPRLTYRIVKEKEATVTRNGVNCWESGGTRTTVLALAGWCGKRPMIP